MDNGRSVWMILLALLGVGLIYLWATGRAKTLVSALTGSPANATTGATPTVSTSGSNPNVGNAIATPQTYVNTPVIAGLGLTMPGTVATSSALAGFTLPTIPQLGTSIPNMVTTPATSVLGSLTTYGSTASIPTEYSSPGSNNWLENLFGSSSLSAGTIPTFDGPNVLVSSTPALTSAQQEIISDNGAPSLPTTSTVPALAQLNGNISLTNVGDEQIPSDAADNF